ncbi:MAG: hypothetical protein HGB33_01305 [Syntrophaceae bacterium]|nr:hypothetical protein [Syntrophaceae bacterium]
MSDFNGSCLGCGTCAEVCPFLSEFGTPHKILLDPPEATFYCTSCRRCEAVCPLGLSPAAAFLETKQRLVRENQMSSSVRKALDDAKAFAKAGHGFPFSFYGIADTVFWPGCGMPANRPELIRKVQDILGRHLEQKVGLVLDCCHDPVFELGDSQTALTALQEINKRLLDSGVKRVISGCLNCHKLLSKYLQSIQVVFILEVLPPEIFKQQQDEHGAIYLHHPCPSSRWVNIPDAARDVINHVYPSRASDGKVERSEPLCCGSGCGLTTTSPELADRFLERIVQEGNGRTIVTYCAGCQNRFLKRGVEAVHLLECLAGVEPRKKVPSPAAQWINRLVLAGRVRLNIPKLLILLSIALLIAVGFYLTSQHIFSAEKLMDLLERNPVLAPVIFLGIYAVAPGLFLPSIPITLAAGFFWGPVWGVVFSITGATIGACLPFFLSRYLLQDFIKNKVSPERWQWLQDKVNQHGWQAVAFTRLIPVFPFNLLNYLFGLTPIAFLQYLWSTFVFMLPACIAFVAFGSSLGELIMRGNIKGVIIGIAVAVIAFLVPLALRPFFRKIGDNKPPVADKKSRKD